MNFKLIHKITAGAVFLISLIVIWSTVQPSVPFWDCGEFIAASFSLQVPHPPGTPFFLLLGRLFAMLPFDWNIGLKVNLISVISSAASVFFLYLIAVKLIENYRGKKPENILDALSTYIAAAIGALSFAFSDTFWFNGVEAEVYAFSTLIFSAVTWLMVCWHEKADRKDNEKYLLMIAYLIGLSTGVHLMSVLAIVPVVMIILFRKYVEDEAALKKTAYIFLAHAAIVLLIAVVMWLDQTSTNPPSPEEYQAYDTKFKMIMAVISIIIMAAFWRKIFTRNSFYIPLIIGGAALFFTYPGIVKYLPSFMSFVGGDNSFVAVIALLVLLAALGFGVNYSVKNNKPTWHLIFMSVIFAIIGFTTFSMVIIRSNENPPMNENEPNTFTELESYLNREQYGDFPTFKRRFATEPHQMGVYSNYTSDFDFFWKYQMHHMMTRYLLWNYVGRSSWEQESGPNMGFLNGVANFFGKPFNIHFEDGKPENTFWGIPFFLGILGIYFHFKKDWKMAAVFMVMFVFMGYLTAFYQNQQEPQPRERDYFYVGAFFVFSIWIAIGIRGIVDVLREKVKNLTLKNVSVAAALGLGIIFVPVKMVTANYFTHDRSQNWVPWDYSYNLLQSCAPNSVLFTNGDNDTFPLWYLQDVEGVRRDVRIANLSLLNTSWYIKQLKNNDPYHVGTVRIRLTDEQIESIRPVQWEPQNVSIPVPKPGIGGISDVIKTYNITDSSIVKSGNVSWKMDNTITFGNIKAVRVQDLLVKEIVEANNWQRPIYFAVTCSEDSKIGLSDYLRMEGMALRLVPEKRENNVEFISEEILKKQLFGNPEQVASKDYKPGFLFRGLNNPNIFFDDNHTRMTVNYRNAYFRLAVFYINKNQNQQAVQTLDAMEKAMPRKIFPVDLGLLYEMGRAYNSAGGKDQYQKIARDVETLSWQKIKENPNDFQSYWSPYRILIDTYENLKEYDNLVKLWEKIGEAYPSDPSVKANIQRYKDLARGITTDTSATDTAK